MAYIVNQAGRIVAVNDDEVQKWLATPGFRKATEQEEKEAIRRRTQVAEQARTQADPSAQGIYLATVSQGGRDGYGVASAKVMQELQKLGVNISTHNTGQKIALLLHNPYSIHRLEAPYRIIYTMFESDKIPADWKDYLEAADLVLVPSKWCADVFAKSGIKTKVVPLGYDDNVFTYRQRPAKRENNQDFVFIHYNAFNIRKGFLEVFKAFCKAFDKTEPVRMVFKTTLDYNPLPITKAEYPNIDIIHGKYSEKELVDLLYTADCFVYPSRGEGFGMTPLEAMATGIPAILPNAHGMTEYFNADCMYEVGIKETCPAIYSRYKGIDVGKMVISDVDDLARKMRYAYEHQEENRRMGVQAAAYVKQWTFAKTALQLKSIFDGTEKLDLKNKPLKNTLNLEGVR